MDFPPPMYRRSDPEGKGRYVVESVRRDTDDRSGTGRDHGCRPCRPEPSVPSHSTGSLCNRPVLQESPMVLSPRNHKGWGRPRHLPLQSQHYHWTVDPRNQIRTPRGSSRLPSTPYPPRQPASSRDPDPTSSSGVVRTGSSRTDADVTGREVKERTLYLFGSGLWWSQTGPSESLPPSRRVGPRRGLRRHRTTEGPDGRGGESDCEGSRHPRHPPLVPDPEKFEEEGSFRGLASLPFPS